MLRRRRRVQNRYNPGRGKKSGRFKLVVILVAVVAVICAVITGLVLGNKAKKSNLESYGRHNLTSYGGVDKPAEDYVALRDIQAMYVDVIGMDKSDFRNSVSNLADGNAVAFKVNDSEGNLFVSFECAEKISFQPSNSNITPSEISDVASDEGKVSVAYFYSAATLEENSSVRALKIGEEIALVTELANSGIDELLLFGIKSADNMEYVNAYLCLAEAACNRTNICVVLEAEALKNADAVKIISATEGYADAYALDFSGVSNAELGKMIEQCAYFITNYNARILVLDAAEEEIKTEITAILESYGVKSYEFIK